jgi:hypothetical protein
MVNSVVWLQPHYRINFDSIKMQGTYVKNTKYYSQKKENQCSRNKCNSALPITLLWYIIYECNINMLQAHSFQSIFFTPLHIRNSLNRETQQATKQNCEHLNTAAGTMCYCAHAQVGRLHFHLVHRLDFTHKPSVIYDGIHHPHNHAILVILVISSRHV